MFAFRLLSTCALILSLIGCGGGSSETPSTTPATSATNSSAPVAVSNDPVASSVPATPPPSTTTSTGNALYDRVPVIANCDEGQLKSSEKTLVLDKLNQVRALHRLPPVAYDAQGDSQTAKSALITVANAKLTHTPLTGDKCYTTEGNDGSGSSNLYVNFSTAASTIASDFSVTQFLIDDAVPSLGHRRWLLHPFLSRTAFGRVDGAPLVSSPWSFITGMSLKVIGFPATNLSASTVEYIAYPEGNYPSAYFKHGWFMSFSVLANKTSSFANGNSAVDFAAATVEVRDAANTLLAVSEKSADYTGFGLPNALQWKVAGTVSNVQYTVAIRGVKVNGAAKDYQYTFRIQ